MSMSRENGMRLPTLTRRPSAAALLLTACLAAAPLLSATAQATSRSFYIENDVLLRSNSTDRNYTGGFGFAVAGPEARGSLAAEHCRRGEQEHCQDIFHLIPQMCGA